MEERRWRILRAALPRRRKIALRTAWCHTFDEFILRADDELGRDGVRIYLKDLEQIAKQTCDLVLLRLARDYLAN